MSTNRTKSVTIITVPYHVGIYNHRVGAGPQQLLPKVQDELESQNVAVKVERIDNVDDFEGEIGRSFELLRRVSRAVCKAKEAGSFPIVLAGNCNTSVGVAAGLRLAGTEDLQLVWMDAHNDADTPDELMHGYFDGMGVSMVSGGSWKALTSTIPGHSPIPMNQVLFCGIRNQTREELMKFDAVGARVISGGDSNQCVESLMKYQLGPKETLVHVDLDVLDPDAVGWANEFPSRGGLSAEGLVQCMGKMGRGNASALTIASFMPGLQGGQAVEAAAIQGISYFFQELFGSSY